MRILQVVTLLSPDGEYGGPARVALNQSAELLSRGHDVLVVGAARGYRDMPTELNGVPVKVFAARTLLPRTGFAGIGAPQLTRWLRSNWARFARVSPSYSLHRPTMYHERSSASFRDCARVAKALLRRWSAPHAACGLFA